MKSSLISSILFALLITVAIISLCYINDFCRDFTKESDSLEELVVEENWEESYNSVMDLLDHIQQESKLTSVFINHEEVDIMEMEVYKLTQFIKEKDKTQSLASIHALKFSLENIKKLHEFNLQNIF